MHKNKLGTNEGYVAYRHKSLVPTVKQGGEKVMICPCLAA